MVFFGLIASLLLRNTCEAELCVDAHQTRASSEGFRWPHPDFGSSPARSEKGSTASCTRASQQKSCDDHARAAVRLEPVSGTRMRRAQKLPWLPAHHRFPHASEVLSGRWRPAVRAHSGRSLLSLKLWFSVWRKRVPTSGTLAKSTNSGAGCKRGISGEEAQRNSLALPLDCGKSASTLVISFNLPVETMCITQGKGVPLQRERCCPPRELRSLCRRRDLRKGKDRWGG